MPKTIREVYGESLLHYGKNDPRIVVLDADVSGSTKSAVFGAECPARFFNVGIAEANMVGIAAGMAGEGKIPFINSFAVFLSSLGLLGARTFGSYAGRNLKFMGAYGGLSDSYDGPTHQAIEDIAVMRSLPHFQVFVASDARQTEWLVKHAIDTPGPMYIRLSREAFPDIYDEKSEFAAGKGMVIRAGTDVSIIACGVMVGAALQAADTLKAHGISARVIDMFCVKPIDRALILDCAAQTKLIVTAEEHNRYGGLGGAVAEVLAEHGSARQIFVALNDTHAETGAYPALLQKYGLDAEAIVTAVTKGLDMAK